MVQETNKTMNAWRYKLIIFRKIRQDFVVPSYKTLVKCFNSYEQNSICVRRTITSFSYLMRFYMWKADLVA